ncbi:2-keto-4-pentenoate hydratase/2-oxohepta-3-ene-1,7-dioic acid hydratase in catechol pathway [Conyzicola lurida]|uniref:2-keto-4-pentenoate hydratase/2-oxohepta-3-ene-1,7-dioic acid hydratase in catechol pathway n=1 Tax=Conyzicola lurida TaxID=1172621 RepID=A0A841AMM9_9MICO|nr:fumarylacetoacetate hydrolase family protein [Conyzicola lurida]MBB5842785.1 2-keto-4-pentenoate hydratase/2-oxohepta-3-ene-1,7-dioic acid hydratase in catechol pathway [Conyzicola lurida]
MTKFLRLGPVGSEIPAVETADGVVHDLRPLTTDIDGAFLRDDGLRAARDAASGLPVLDGAAGLRVGAPIARPGAVLCIGQNYAAHAAESGNGAPTVPILFFKHPNTVVGPFDDIHVPPRAAKVDWEVELGVVIGRRARYLESVDDALDHVAGYVVSHDVSERTWQKDESGGQWSKGKIAETFNPVGPYLVPADEVDPQNLRLWSTVNGEARQDSSTADMVFSVAFLVWHLSQYGVLDPGDLVNTGTPEGVAMSGRFPYLAAGDVVELGVEGLGVMRQTLVPAPR